MPKSVFENAVRRFLIGLGKNGSLPTQETAKGEFYAKGHGYEFVGNARGFSVRMPYDRVKGRTWVQVPIGGVV